jgi:hypothetical protein
MVAIAQSNRFAWDALEAHSDLDRFCLVRDRLPDPRLVQYLEVMRGNEPMIFWCGQCRACCWPRRPGAGHALRRLLADRRLDSAGTG